MMKDGIPLIRLVLVALSVLAAPGAAAPASASPTPHFILVFKSHFDLGYSALAREVVHEYRTTMIDRALQTIAANRQQAPNERFVWTVPGYPMAMILGEGQTTARQAAVGQALREGSLAVHALPGTLHTATLELEELVRGLGLASSLCRRNRLPLPEDAKMTDVPAHTWVLPTLLHHAGVKFLHIGCNITNVRMDVPPLFWWEGPDGSRLLTMYSHGYGTSLFPPAGWPHASWLALLHAGDNQGPPAADEVRRHIEAIQQRFPKARVTVGRMSDFAEAILAEKPDLPVVRGDMSDSWIHGPMCSPLAAQTARRVRPLLGALDGLRTLGHAWGIAHGEVKDELPALYTSSLLYGEHTWGLAHQHFIPSLYGDAWREMLLTGLDPAYQRMVESFDEHDRYIERVADRVVPLWENALHTLAEHVNQPGLRFVVYNPLPWPRDGVVDLALPFMGNLRGPSVKPVDGGRAQPIHTWGSETRRIARFHAEDIPAMGYRTYVMSGEAAAGDTSLVAEPAGHTIENKWFKVQFDPERGCVQSIIDKASGRELVEGSAPHGLGQYLYERFGKKEVLAYLGAYIDPRYRGSHYRITAKSHFLPDDLAYSAFSPSTMTLKVEQTAVSVTGTLFPPPGPCENPHTAALAITLYRDEPVLDLKLSVVNKPALEQPDAGWICLPFAVDRPAIRIGRVGSIIDPARDSLAGGNNAYFWSNHGITLSDPAGAGVGFCPVNSPALSFGEPGIMKFKPRFDCDNGRVYVNLFNNQWNTNFRSFWGGNLVSRVRIWAFSKFDAEAELFTKAWEARVPLQVGASVAPPGTLPPAQRGLTLSRKGILVPAFGPNPDGEGTILRLWEHTGRAGPCTISLPEGLAAETVQPLDLRGRPFGEAVPVRDGQFTLNVPAFAPVTVRIH